MRDLEDDLPDTAPTDGPRNRARKSARHVPEIADDANVPSTEPRAKQAAKPAPTDAPAATATVRIGPDQLVTDTKAEPLEDQGAWYWVGLLPGAPSSCIAVAGVAFPRTTEIPFMGIRDPRDQDRQPADGDVMRLPASKVREIARQVKMRAVRFSHEADSEYEQKRAREGYSQRLGAIVRYTSAADVEAAREQGRIIQVTAPRQGDVPLSRYLFCVMLSESYPRPRWAGQYDLPRPMSETGIEFPAPDAPPLPADARVNLARSEGMRPAVGSA